MNSRIPSTSYSPGAPGHPHRSLLLGAPMPQLFPRLIFSRRTTAPHHSARLGAPLPQGLSRLIFSGRATAPHRSARLGAPLPPGAAAPPRGMTSGGQAWSADCGPALAARVS